MKTKRNFNKGIALVMSAALVLGLVPSLPGIGVSARADEASVPSATAYATSKQLMNDFDPSSDNSANGRLAFGTYDGNDQQWFILGRDGGVSGANIAIFAASAMGSAAFNSNHNSDIPTASYNGTDVYWNHYGASTLRNTTLKEMETSCFADGEQDLMQPSTVSTIDTYHSSLSSSPYSFATYTTADVLYVASAGDLAYSVGGSDIYVGTSNGKKMPLSTYWNSNIGSQLWLRSPYFNNDYNHYALYAIRFVSAESTVLSAMWAASSTFDPRRT